jgi:hypothetical protein
MDTKNRIKKIVEDYKRLFPEEYAIVVRGIQMKKELTRDKYASIEGMFDGRALYEIPETLHNMLAHSLIQEDIVWLKSGGHDRKEGGRWFAKTFPEFALPDYI